MLAGLLILALPATAGKIKRFTDEEGTVHITDSEPGEPAKPGAGAAPVVRPYSSPAPGEAPVVQAPTPPSPPAETSAVQPAPAPEPEEESPEEEEGPEEKTEQGGPEA